MSGFTQERPQLAVEQHIWLSMQSLSVEQDWGHVAGVATPLTTCGQTAARWGTGVTGVSVTGGTVPGGRVGLVGG